MRTSRGYGAARRARFSVKAKGKEKGFAWAWAERVEPKKAKVRNPEVFAFCVANLTIKEMILGAGGGQFVHDPHYNGYPAVTVRLTEIDFTELEDLVVEAWKCKAPRQLVSQFDEGRG